MNIQSIPNTTTRKAIVTNATQTGSAFGIVIGSGEGIFIPVAVATAGGAKIGSLYAMQTIPNPNELSHDKTPLMCVKMAPTEMQEFANPMVSATSDDARSFTNKIMESGVWTNGEIFRELMCDPNAKREDNVAAYSAIGNELRRMFSADQCVKFTMYRTATQTKASAEWYTTADEVEPCEMVDE